MGNANAQKTNRGFASAGDIAKVKLLPVAEQKNLLSSPYSWERTAAILALAEYISPNDMVFASQLLKILQTEKALYTRLAIAEVLQAGNLQTARLLCGYLGCIGSNQLKALEAPSKKKSYPLPRDLAARILGKMQPEILPALIEILHGSDVVKISEAIDAYGYLLFYHPGFAMKDHFLTIQQLLSAYASNELLVYKCATCLSALRLEESKALLESLQNHSNLYVAQNAERSLQLLHNIKK